jgi:hypothetical protein
MRGSGAVAVMTMAIPVADIFDAVGAAVDGGSDITDAAEAACESFAASTKVLLASGAAVPIASLTAGDKVLATNTNTGKTQAEPVEAVMVHRDGDRYDLTTKSRRRTAVIDTTSNHLFWDQTTGRWTRAAALRPGDHLRTPSGTAATVMGGHVPADSVGWMWDLSVPGGNDHDFYVDTTAAPVLVHNCGPDEENPWAKPPPEQEPPRSQWKAETKPGDMTPPGQKWNPDNAPPPNAGLGTRIAYVLGRLFQFFHPPHS